MTDLYLPTPDFHLVKAGKDVQSDGTKDLLKQAKHLVAAYNATPGHETFQPLLDWSYLSVHNGDLDSRDNPGLRAIYTWSRDDVAFPGAPALDRGGQRPRPPQADGLRPRGPAGRRRCATAGARSSGSAATRGSS